MSKYTSGIKYLTVGITLIAQPAFGSSLIPNPLPPALGDETNIPIPSDNIIPLPSSVTPSFTPVTGSPFTGTWVGTGADSPWVDVDTFNGIGSGTRNLDVGITTFDFVTTPLPVGTYFNFSDVDNGSRTSSEQFILEAFDTSGNLITTNWLSEPFSVRGTSNFSELPSSDFNSGTYTIDGMDITGNPSVNFTLTNLEEIGRLVINKQQGNNSFVLLAPTPTEHPTTVPEPTSLLALTAISLICFNYRRKCRLN